MSGVLLGREHWLAANARRWNRAWGDPYDATPTIYVRQCSGPGWWVVVEPACDIVSRYFYAHADALSHAADVHRFAGWPIEDAHVEVRS